ncbi:MAG: LytTR family transcriptional regulator DNA-binding domain-containing protein, partial [Lachnospiraceae bacterium]|nr:LytTR family transcriptional regulator DNA-binding domain-containing protein [Lachnospiraceae bacterium]
VISQRDIYRIRTQGREVLLDTQDRSYSVRGTIAKFEMELDQERFFRISQSEIINLYKVEAFDFNVTGTVGVLFDNGVRSWVARRCVKPLRDLLKSRFGNA